MQYIQNIPVDTKTDEMQRGRNFVAHVLRTQSLSFPLKSVICIFRRGALSMDFTALKINASDQNEIVSF